MRKFLLFHVEEVIGCGNSVIEQAMATIKEGDFLVWLDAGCKINKGGENRFQEYINMLNNSQYDVLGFQVKVKYSEIKWTTQRLFLAFGVEEGDVDITHTGQIQSGTLIFQKGPHYRKWMELCRSVITMDPWMITDKFSSESHSLNCLFIENRHDQSIMSVAMKKLGWVSLTYVETLSAQLDRPFHVMRLKE